MTNLSEDERWSRHRAELRDSLRRQQQLEAEATRERDLFFAGLSQCALDTDLVTAHQLTHEEAKAYWISPDRREEIVADVRRRQQS